MAGSFPLRYWFEWRLFFELAIGFEIGVPGIRFWLVWGLRLAVGCIQWRWCWLFLNGDWIAVQFEFWIGHLDLVIASHWLEWVLHRRRFCIVA